MPRTARAALEGGWFEGNVKRPAAQSLRAAGVKANFIASAQNGAIIAVFVESVCHLFFRCKKRGPGRSADSQARLRLSPCGPSRFPRCCPRGQLAGRLSLLSFEPEKEKNMTLRLTAWRDSLLAKTALLFVLWLVLCIPLSEILGLIRERGDSQRSAAEELAQTHVGAQTLAAPYLLVPYVERWREPVRDDKGQITGEELRQRQDAAIVFPKTQTMQGALATQERYRGIFKVPFYRLTAKVQGEIPPFDVDSLPHSVEGSQIEVGGEAGAPVLVLSMSDLRGLEGAPQLEAAGQALPLERGLPRAVAQSALAAGSVQAALSGQALDTWQQGQALPYVLDMTLAGQSHLAVAPLGEDTTAQLSSAWPHPGFGGRFLAAERTVSDTGFEAHWRISSLTTQARAQLAAALKQEKAANLERLETFDVTLTQPVNVYSMSERAAKYGGLFIALVIMAAFMVELFKRLRLHPVQYGLVGLSIAVFFLLLLAMSEKMAFAWAYAGAAAASVALLGLYFSAVLGGAQRGGALAAYVAVLYAALYGLLASENNALLLGALLVFAMLAALMLGTRHVDWWQLGGGKERGIEPPDFPERG